MPMVKAEIAGKAPGKASPSTPLSPEGQSKTVTAEQAEFLGSLFELEKALNKKGFSIVTVLKETAASGKLGIKL